MGRDRKYYRNQRERVSERKYRILTEVYGEGAIEGYVKNGSKNSLSKAKIHCSCWMCQKGKPHSQKRREISANQDLNNYGGLV